MDRVHIQFINNVVQCRAVSSDKHFHFSESEETNDVTLTNHTLVGFPENAHPVLFEIGKEYNCGPIVSSALRSDFLEFKFEIPFVTSSKSKEPLNYKQRLYESTELNSISSKLMYGLNASKAKMNMTDTTYGVLFDNNKFIANFSSDNNPGWINAKDFALIKPYRDIMNLWWFGRQDKNICAQHKYDFDSALIRPSVANLRFDKSLINAFFPGDKYHVNPLSADDLYGAVQININFTMTFPEKC